MLKTYLFAICIETQDNNIAYTMIMRSVSLSCQSPNGGSAIGVARTMFPTRIDVGEGVDRAVGKTGGCAVF